MRTSADIYSHTTRDNDRAAALCWDNITRKARNKNSTGVNGVCYHQQAESGAADEVIMSIAGHVSRAMLSLYSHVRMEANPIAEFGRTSQSSFECRSA